MDFTTTKFCMNKKTVYKILIKADIIYLIRFSGIIIICNDLLKLNQHSEFLVTSIAIDTHLLYLD